MKLTRAQRGTLNQMTAMACLWEQTKADAYTPSDGSAPGADAKRIIRGCRASVRRFQALRDRLLRDSIEQEARRYGSNR